MTTQYEHPVLEHLTTLCIVTYVGAQAMRRAPRAVVRTHSIRVSTRRALPGRHTRGDGCDERGRFREQGQRR